ncbi:MAG: hypothetical protein U5N85_09890 [Arcicella sp.]|nr:hypothetical protein [Arcicella sp.]
MKRYITILLLMVGYLQSQAQNGVPSKRTYEYDDLNRLSKVYVYNGATLTHTITYSFDELGNRLSKVVAVFCGSMFSVVSGDWNTNATWSCGRTPLITDDVTISTGHTVTIPAGQTGFVQNLMLNGTLVNSQLLKFKEQ